MTRLAPGRILTLNRGSATLKASLYEAEARERRILSIQFERADSPAPHATIQDRSGKAVLDATLENAPPNAALRRVFDGLDAQGYFDHLVAAGHRIVQGGAQFQKPLRIDAEILARLKQLVPLDPDHLPAALGVIDFVSERWPELPQFACFDTGFHASLPRLARLYALPRRLLEGGVTRFGFHGLSYEYILGELRALDGALAEGRVIVAHLGNGASMAALRGGRSVDTSMGFTPLEGLVMGTRSGDVDPGALLYLLEQCKMSPADLAECLNKQSGLLGVSGSSGDMRDLLAQAPRDEHAAEAVELFCYRAKKYVGAYAAALGGLDLLVFTGGIGEKAAAVRQRICENLAFLGIELDPQRNQANDPVISSAASRVKVRVIETNEDLAIVRHVLDLLGRA